MIYSLSLNRGPWRGDYRGNSSCWEMGEVADLTTHENGGFTDYLPVSEIPANGTLVIQLQSK